MAATGIVLTGATPAHAAETMPLRVDDAHVDGRSLVDRDGEVPLPTRGDVPITITLTNQSGSTIRIRALRISVALLGISFANFQATVDEEVGPGQTLQIARPGDFFDLDKAAIGKVNSRLDVLDEGRQVVARHSFDATVPGRLTSSEGILLFELSAVAAIGLVEILVRIARRTLTANRFLRGVLFAFTAAAAGVSVVIALAAAEVALLETPRWLPAVSLVTAIAFALGYLLPAAWERDLGDRAEQRVIDLVATEAVERASGEHARRTTGGTAVVGTVAGSRTSQQSGEFAPQHDSGGFVPHHDSGPVEPVEPVE
jgi:hypothetical protein